MKNTNQLKSITISIKTYVIWYFTNCQNRKWVKQKFLLSYTTFFFLVLGGGGGGCERQLHFNLSLGMNLIPRMEYKYDDTIVFWFSNETHQLEQNCTNVQESWDINQIFRFQPSSSFFFDRDIRMHLLFLQHWRYLQNRDLFLAARSRDGKFKTSV